MACSLFQCGFFFGSLLSHRNSHHPVFPFLLQLVCRYSNLGDTDEGHRLGNISRILFERFPNRNFLPRFYVAYYSYVHPRTNPIDECMQQLVYAQQVGLQTGDNECAMVSTGKL
jgi:hypothetical protein